VKSNHEQRAAVAPGKGSVCILATFDSSSRPYLVFLVALDFERTSYSIQSLGGEHGLFFTTWSRPLRIEWADHTSGAQPPVEHYIPFKFFRENPRVTSGRTGFFTFRKPREARDLNNFARVLSQTITMFAEAVRKQYLEKIAAQSTGQLFSDALYDRRPKFLDAEKQQLACAYTLGLPSVG